MTSKLSYGTGLYHRQYTEGMLWDKQNARAVQMSQGSKSEFSFLANQSLDRGFMKGI